MSNFNIAPAVTDATAGSVSLGEALLLHRIKTREHEGRRESLPIDLAIELVCRFHNPEPFEPQCQRLVAELSLSHLRHDEFPRLVLPRFVDGLRLVSLVRLFAYCHIWSYTGDFIFMSSASPCMFLFGSFPSETPC